MLMVFVAVCLWFVDVRCGLLLFVVVFCCLLVVYCLCVKRCLLLVVRCLQVVVSRLLSGFA